MEKYLQAVELLKEINDPEKNFYKHFNYESEEEKTGDPGQARGFAR